MLLKSRFAPALCLLLTAVAASAQTLEENVLRCLSAQPNDVRLTCYDEVAENLRGASETASPDSDQGSTDNAVPDQPDKGEWLIYTEVSPIDDSLGVFLTLDSDDPIIGPYGQYGPMVLILRCMENTTAVNINFNDHFMASIQGAGRVEYRLDDQPVRTANMQESSNNKSLGLWRGREAIPFIENLLESETLVIRAAPYNESPLTGSFTLAGLDQVIPQLRETCGW